MKSSRYEILPRIRRMSWGSVEKPVYCCTWKDPGPLVQIKGEPLRYVWTLVGFGNTPEAALADCRERYMVYRQWKNIYIEGLQRRPDTSLGASDHHIATSNLPWWKRLFRV